VHICRRCDDLRREHQREDSLRRLTRGGGQVPPGVRPVLRRSEADTLRAFEYAPPLSHPQCDPETEQEPTVDPFEMSDLMDLVAWLKAVVRALIVCTEHYMPIKLSSLSNFSVTVGRVYYKAMTNSGLFNLLDLVGATLKARSEGTVIVAIEAFDGEHRGRQQGGGQYWARQAAISVQALLPGEDQASAKSMLGQATRVKALCGRAITLLSNGPLVTPNIPGIWAPPLAYPAAPQPMAAAAGVVPATLAAAPIAAVAAAGVAPTAAAAPVAAEELALV
jgi:hypothetical protein